MIFSNFHSCFELGLVVFSCVLLQPLDGAFALLSTSIVQSVKQGQIIENYANAYEGFNGLLSHILQTVANFAMKNVSAKLFRWLFSHQLLHLWNQITFFSISRIKARMNEAERKGTLILKE